MYYGNSFIKVLRDHIYSNMALSINVIDKDLESKIQDDLRLIKSVSLRTEVESFMLNRELTI